MHTNRYFLAAALAMSIAAPCSVFGAHKGVGAAAVAARSLRDEGPMPSLGGASGWLNSAPLTAEALRGKVVLIDFWTYSCINWLRTEPYVRAWAEKYRAQGLVVIGVHSPEFEFEKDAANVNWAVNSMNVDYPVAIDSDHAVWNAFRNSYWPALYIVDSHGLIRYHQFGEGGYEQSERVIQQLLTEAGSQAVNHEPISIDGRGLELAADWANLKSPENYVGYERTENFVSRDGTIPDKHHVYVAPSHLRLNHWALAGDWIVRKQYIESTRVNARITYRFHARDLHLVMGPAMAGAPVRFRVLIDGQAPGAARGLDVDAQGNGTVRESRLYQLIRQTEPIADRDIEIEFLDAGALAYSFTFG